MVSTLVVHCSDSSWTCKEEINLAELVYQARHDVDRAESQSQPISDSQRVMIIISKKPMIALRYQLPNGMVSIYTLALLKGSTAKFLSGSKVADQL